MSQNRNKAFYENEYRKIYKDITSRYGSDVTYNDFLERVGKEYFGNKFAGVFPCDKIKKMKIGQYAIVNLDKSHEAGSHWIGLVKGSKKNIYAFDSFGRKGYKILPGGSLGNGKFIDTELDKEQREEDNSCGQHVLSFLLLYDKYGWKGAKHI